LAFQVLAQESVVLRRDSGRRDAGRYGGDRHFFMSDVALYRRILSGRAGLWAAPVRAVLRAMELPYAAAIARRNRGYDAGRDVVRIDAPVISVGNLTVGGTGKTPLVVEIVRRLERMGRNPAVVARGYRAGRDGANDEQRLIERECPGIAYVAGADRVAAARRAVAAKGADTIVLDDGFQHRRLARDLDLVLIDATCPFGYGHLLPRGLLREPVASLRRAGLIVLTRTDLASANDLARIDRVLDTHAPDIPRIRCHHRVTGLTDVAGAAVAEPVAGARALLFAAIGNPAAFRATALSLGAVDAGHRWFPDHCAYCAGDVDDLLRLAREARAEVLLTTAKDAVKLAALGSFAHARIRVIAIRIDFDDDGDKMLQSAIESAVSRAGRDDVSRDGN
jgi:tetraacyldisaccharide 4'-kinase